MLVMFLSYSPVMDKKYIVQCKLESQQMKF